MNARLLVLGLLRDGPRHGYEMQKWLEESRTDLWADVLPGSIYHALKQMEKERLVEVTATERAGHRARAVYAITDAGRREFLTLLRGGWDEPPASFPQTLYTLLTFSDALPAAERRAGVERLIVELERQRAVWIEGERAKADALPEWGRDVFQNGRDHINADLRLLRRLLDLWSS